MAKLALQDYGQDGSAVTTQAAAAGGDQAPNLGGTVLLRLVKPGTGDARVRRKAARPDDQGFSHDLTYTVSAGASVWVPLGPRDRFGPYVSLEYPDGVDPNGDGPLEVGAARIPELRGLADSIPPAPALGANPGDVPIVSYKGGFTPSAEAVPATSDGDLLRNDGSTEPWVHNETGATIRVWFRAVPSDQGIANHHFVDVPDGQWLQALTLDTYRFGRQVGITYSDTADQALGSVNGIELFAARNASY